MSEYGAINMSELYDRQETLDLVSYDSVLVIGAGGIGSWVVLDIALSGCVNNVSVCDPDTLEESNLNRTPFTRQHVGMKKVWAIRDLVSERRHDVTVIPLDGIVQSLDIDISGYDVVIDCSDGLMVKEWVIGQKFASYMKLGYDGWSVTIDGSNVMPWDDGANGYRTVPSFIVPPQLLAALAVGALLNGDIPNEVKTFDVKDVVGRM